MKNHARPQRRSERGFAIILTLLVITMMTILVVGFNAATRTEQLAARNFSYQEVSGQMAMRGVNEAIELLNVQLVSSNIATQPGAVYLLPSPNPIPLTSASVAGANQNNTTNINIWRQGTNGFNYFIMSNNNSTAFTVPLVDVRLSQVPGGGAGPSGPIGRFGFWIDDDGSRLNLNYAAPYGPGSTPPNRPDFLPTNARPLVLTTNVLTNLTLLNLVQQGTNSVLSLVNPSAAQQNNPGLGWGYFFTPRQLANLAGMTEARYNSAMFQVGAGPASAPARSYPLVALANRFRIPVDLSESGTIGFFGQEEFGGSPNYTANYASFDRVISGVVSNYFRGPGYEAYFGDERGFVQKYGEDIARQIAVNINDATLPSTNNAAAFTGAFAGVNSDNPVPESVFGLRPTPFLNEIAVAVALNTNHPPQEDKNQLFAEVQIHFRLELVDPYRTGMGTNWFAFFKVKSLRFSGQAILDGKTTSFTNNAKFSENWNFLPKDKNLAIGINDKAKPFVPSRDFLFSFVLTPTAPPGGVIPMLPTDPTTQIILDKVEVEPGLVVLHAGPDLEQTQRIRDWALELDFPVLKFSGADIQNNVNPGIGYGDRDGRGTGAYAPQISFGLNAQGIAKNDPRVRRFPSSAPTWSQSQPPWKKVGGTNDEPIMTLGSNNSVVNFSSGTGLPGIQNDPSPGGNDIFAHPSFAGITNHALGKANWSSVFELTKIHTGLQWRTLQMRSQEAGEASLDYVPDWALLEAFTVGNGAVAAPLKVNLNSLADANLSAANAVAGGLARVPAVASVLAGMTTQNAPLARAKGFPLRLPPAAGFSEPIGTTSSPGFLRVATNLTTLNFTETWLERRQNFAACPANAYALPAEVLEVKGVANLLDRDTQEGEELTANEGRALGVFESFTTRSEVFTVFSVGYAVDRTGRIASESRVRAQVARDPATGRFRLVFAEPLSWPP